MSHHFAAQHRHEPDALRARVMPTVRRREELQEYDPERGINSSTWLALDESERLALVEAYHRRARVRLPNARLHAAIHTIVENQLASSEPDVVAALARLRSEGLPRHEAVHAIGQVLTNTIHEGLSGTHGSNLGTPYLARLRSLTAERWLNQELE
jgi:hypothetical protein